MTQKTATTLSITAAAVFGALSAGLTGCAGIAESSASSASISSISASSAGAMAMNSDYQDDIRVATSTAIASAATSDDLLNQIAQIATEHGVADWEAEEATFLAIGAGLRDAGVGEEEARQQADQIAGRGTLAAANILVGFRA